MQVRPHPQVASVANFPIRNLATVPEATVAHILKYITDYPSLDKRGIIITVFHFWSACVKALKCKPSANCACTVPLIDGFGLLVCVYSWSPASNSRRV